MEQMDKLARQPNSVVISVQLDLNIEFLKDQMWDRLGVNRIYTKKRGERPDLSDPLVVRRGATIEHVVSISEPRRIHRLARVRHSSKINLSLHSVIKYTVRWLTSLNSECQADQPVQTWTERLTLSMALSALVYGKSSK